MAVAVDCSDKERLACLMSVLHNATCGRRWGTERPRLQNLSPFSPLEERWQRYCSISNFLWLCNIFSPFHPWSPLMDMMNSFLFLFTFFTHLSGCWRVAEAFGAFVALFYSLCLLGIIQCVLSLFDSHTSSRRLRWLNSREWSRSPFSLHYTHRTSPRLIYSSFSSRQCGETALVSFWSGAWREPGMVLSARIPLCNGNDNCSLSPCPDSFSTHRWRQVVVGKLGPDPF